MWHDERSYPPSWQLDPTEGPCRIRRRLQRCHTGIPPRFFKDGNKLKTGELSFKYIPEFQGGVVCSSFLALLFHNQHLINRITLFFVVQYSESEKYEPPLAYLFDEDASTSDSAALIYRLHTNEKIEFTCRCTSVTPSSETLGELLLGKSTTYI